jgi:hypothetical protein
MSIGVDWLLMVCGEQADWVPNALLDQNYKEERVKHKCQWSVP